MFPSVTPRGWEALEQLGGFFQRPSSARSPGAGLQRIGTRRAIGASFESSAVGEKGLRVDGVVVRGEGRSMVPAVDQDVTPLRGRYAGPRTRLRVAGTAVAIALLISWIALFSLELQSGTAPRVFTEETATSYANWVLFVGLGLAIGVTIWAVVALGAPGADRVRVDPEGIAFTWRNGRVTVVPWSSPRFHLDLWVVPKVAGTPENLQVAARAKLRFHGPTDLSEEVFRAILDAAAAHGLRISKRRSHGLFPREPISTLKIRPPPHPST